MTTHHRYRGRRSLASFSFLGFCVLAGIGGAVLGAQSADPAPKDSSDSSASQSQADRERRLEQIESQLRDLLKSVDEMRKTDSAAVASSSVPGSGRAVSTETRVPSATPSGGIVLDPKWIKAMSWRSIGPAGMGGRIVDFAVNESDPSMYWVATASGGLLKTVNNGYSFVHQFDHEATVSIGSVCVAPSDPNIVWVGTGENNPRNSVSYGDGVYKSTDGGKTWKNMGLKKSFQIGRIVIDPNNPDIVYIGALGRLYGPNEERGLYKTTDGGNTWERVLYVDDRTGVIDIKMKSDDPDTLLAATWERRRDGYDSHPGGKMADGYDGYDPIVKWGAGGGIWKTTDGGKTWRRLSNGLPTSNMGRIGIDFYRKDPNEVFAIIDCAKIGMGTPPKPRQVVDVDLFGQDADDGVRIVNVRPNGASAKAGIEPNDLIVAMDGTPIDQGDELSEHLQAHKVGDKVKYKVLRDGETHEIEVTLAEAPQGGRGRGGRGGGGAAGGAYLGITGEDDQNAVRLTNVVEDSPAAKAGAKVGDFVIAVGDKEIHGYEQLLEAIGSHKAGDKIDLNLRTGDASRKAEVTLAQAPSRRGGGTGGGGGPTATRPHGGIYGGQNPNVQDDQGAKGFEYGGIYKSTDAGESWTRVNSLNPRPMYFSLIRVDPQDDKYLYVGGVSMYKSVDGGKTFSATAGRGVHADQHAMWIDPRDGRHILVGCDGGFYCSYDRSAHWDHLNNMAIGQFYDVRISLSHPYRVVGGLQDNGSWMGPAISLDGFGPINEDWINVGGGDGFQCAVDPENPDLVYSESQDGAMSRRNLRTGERSGIRPRAPQTQPAARGGRPSQQASESESASASSAESGGQTEESNASPRGGFGARGGFGGPGGQSPYSFNWNTPFILSSHNSRILYCAGNYVFRSLDRGDNLQIISPKVTTTEFGSGTALSESPRNPDVIYAGTDDGALWVTRDGGKSWNNVAANVGLPGPRWVASLEASRYADGRCYVAFDAHRSDDDKPYLYVTQDFGKTWKSVTANLPWGSTHCLREDMVNEDLLYAGTEFGAWCSLDRGKAWNKLGGNLPTVDVHQFAQHPVNGQIVAATHGRSLWVLDVSALRQIKPQYLADKPELYEPPPAIRWRSEPSRGGTNRHFSGENPDFGADIYYSLPKEAKKASIKIVDIAGKTIWEAAAQTKPGLYRVAWNLRPTSQQGFGGRGGGQGFGRGGRGGGTRAGGGGVPGGQAAGGEQAAGRAGGEAGPGGAAGAGGGQGFVGGRGGFAGRGGFGGFARAATISPGAYRVILTVDGQDIAQTLRVEADPVVSDSVVMASNTPDLGEEDEEEEERAAQDIQIQDQDRGIREEGEDADRERIR